MLEKGDVLTNLLKVTEQHENKLHRLSDEKYVEQFQEEWTKLRDVYVNLNGVFPTCIKSKMTHRLLMLHLHIPRFYMKQGSYGTNLHEKWNISPPLSYCHEAQSKMAVNQWKLMNYLILLNGQ